MNKINNISLDGLKIIDFLNERFKLTKNWQEKYKGLQVKLDNFIKLLKDEKISDEISKFLEEDDKLNFISNKKIKELLINSPEGKKTNLIGMYNSKFIVECQNIDKIFNKYNLNIVNISKNIESLVKYDIKSLKKNISNYNNQFKTINKSIEQKNSNNNYLNKEILWFLKNNFKYESKEDIYQINIDDVYNNYLNNIINLVKDFDNSFLEFDKNFGFKKIIDIYIKFTNILGNEPSDFKNILDYKNEVNTLNLESFNDFLNKKNEEIFEGFVVIDETEASNVNKKKKEYFLLFDKSKRSKLIIELHEILNFFKMRNLSNEYSKEENLNLENIDINSIVNHLNKLICLLTNNDICNLFIYIDLPKYLN